MNTEPRAYVEVPSPSLLLRVQINPAPEKPVATTLMPYDEIKHLLSNKPLRRPNRTKSIKQ